jgi:hypothetical protein
MSGKSLREKFPEQILTDLPRFSNFASAPGFAAIAVSR